MSKNRKTWASLRKGGDIGVDEAQTKARSLLSSLSQGHAGVALEEYLSAILLEVCPKNTHEALLEDRGRKALASELLTMLQQDGPKNVQETD